MTKKPLIAVLNGDILSQPPLWLMRQAGRYLPEYRELRAKAGGFLDMVYNSDFAAEVTLQPIKRFGFDAAILFSDILVIPHALGQHLEFVAGEGPKLQPVRSLSDLEQLNQKPVDQTLDPVYQTISKLKQSLNGSKTALIGFAGAPWTIAAYMITGHGSRNWDEARLTLLKNPEFADRLFSMIIDATAHYLKQQIRHGAEVIQLFDSWAGSVPAAYFDAWVYQPMMEITRRVKQDYPEILFIGFPRGAGANYRRFVNKAGFDALALDQSIDPQWAAMHLQRYLPVQGNLDPMILATGGEILENQVRSILKHFQGRPHIFNLGHGIDKDTPITHVEQLVALVRGNTHSRTISKHSIGSAA